MGTKDERVVNAKLATLEDLPTGPRPWLDPAEVRRRGRARRLRRRSGVAVAALAVVVLAATLVPVGLHSQSPPNAELRVAATLGPATQLVSDTHDTGGVSGSAFSKAVAGSEQRFSLSLLRQLAASSPASTNLVISPSSLATALSMLELGAEGATEAQIARALGSGTLAPQQQAAGWSALSAELAAASRADGVVLQSANSLWLQKGLAMDPSFMGDLSRYFAAGVWQVSFADDPTAAIGALNAWVSKETQGRITTLFGPGAITSQTELVLANAVYFRAAWKQPFRGTTTPARFHLPSGATVSVPFLHTATNDPLDVSASVADGTDVVQLPYVGGRVAALVVMPTSGSLADVVASLTPSRLGRLVSGLAPTRLNLAMPSLSLSDGHQLVPTLQRLGIKDAFDSGLADLSGLTATPLVVTDVAQKATLDVTAWGTEASAATGIATASSAQLASMTLTIDHPFLFVVRDTHTGEILFEAQVADPAAVSS